MKTVAVTSLLLGLAVLATGPAAADIVKRSEAHRATRLAVENFAGELRTEQGTAPSIEITLEGPEQDVRDVDVRVEGGTLRVIDRRSSTSSTTGSGVVNRTIVGSRTNMAIGGGSVAEQIIGNQRYIARGGRDDTIRATVKLPDGTPVRLRDFVGDAQLHDFHASSQVSVLGGSVALEAARDASLGVSGAGSIRANRASGPLSLSIDGAGDITINSGAVPSLDVSVNGTGDVNARVRADQARLQVMGVGNVFVESVATPPKVDVMGLGNIRIGNR